MPAANSLSYARTRVLTALSSISESRRCAPGLSSAHICTLTTYQGANYVELNPVKGTGKPGGGGRRGEIREFSKASRRRLMKLINTINRGKIQKPYFVTLTYPSTWPTSARTWKAHLRALRERIKRKYGKVPAIWRLEFQKRGAPHFHLLLWLEVEEKHVGKELERAAIKEKYELDTVFLSQLQEDLSSWWYEIVGSGDPKHYQAGTRCELPRSWKGVNGYLSKYVAKVEKLADGVESPGRFWGCWYRDLLPIDPEDTNLSWDQFFKLRRILRRHAGFQARRWEVGKVGVFASHEGANRLLAWLGIIGSDGTHGRCGPGRPRPRPLRPDGPKGQTA